MSDSVPTPPRWSPNVLRDATTAERLPAAAAAYAEAGIPVFPCAPQGKTPLTRAGFHDATAEPALVAAWWRRWPTANIGLPTGAATGVDVVDVDVHRGGSGFRSFEQARAAGLTDGWVWLVRTPSGGVHAYYVRRGGNTTGPEQRSWQIPKRHIDFRGDGGYVIAPPSVLVHSSGELRPYDLIAVAQHQPRPVDARRLREFLDPLRPVPAHPVPPVRSSGPDRLAQWVAAQPEGGRNAGLFWAACRMAEDGHELGRAQSVLGHAAREAGLPEREVDLTIRSAYRRAARGQPDTVVVGGDARPVATAAGVSL